MRGKWLLIGGIVLLAAAGSGAFVVWKKQTAPKPAPKQEAAKELPPGAEISLQGHLRAHNIVVLKAPIDGILEEVPVSPGDEVFEGQILGRVANQTLEQNEREASLELERAQARLNAMESALIAARLEQNRAEADASRARSEEMRTERIQKRQQLLWNEGATPRKAYESAENEYLAARKESATLTALSRQIAERVEQAGKDIEAAKKTLDEEQQQYSTAKDELAASDMHSPVDGLLVSVKKKAGDEVKKEADVIFEIGVDLVALEAVIDAEENVLKRIQPGSQALVMIAELPGDGLPGKVSKVENGQIFVEFASPSPLIRPGMNVAVRLKLT